MAVKVHVTSMLLWEGSQTLLRVDMQDGIPVIHVMYSDKLPSM